MEIQPNCTDINEPGLIRFDEALAQILNSVSSIDDFERIAIEKACSRALQQSIVSSFNVPPHTNSAVDGYAVNSQDLPADGKTAKLKISGIAYAGKPCAQTNTPGQCIRIMTGAVLPEGCDTVIMQEQVIVENEHILLDDRHRPGQNVRQAGEDLQLGQTVLPSGKFLTPPDIGLIASLGITEINVKRKIKIAIASTGDEIHNIGSTLTGSGIYDSNRYSLMAALDRPDVEIINLGIIEDHPEALLECFNETSGYCDMIISSGGVSVGDADHTRMALQQTGQVNFWKVAIKPGRPLAFGKINDAVFFGLPGNPVAVMVTFYLFVLPALEKILGITDKPIAPAIKAKSLENIRKRPGRTEIQRGIIEKNVNGDWTVKTTGKQGSGILRSMSLANAFIILPHEASMVKKGDLVTIQPFSGLY